MLLAKKLNCAGCSNNSNVAHIYEYSYIVIEIHISLSLGWTRTGSTSKYTNKASLDSQRELQTKQFRWFQKFALIEIYESVN